MCISAARDFLRTLYGTLEGEQCLTLTAIHPARDRASPSRHVTLADTDGLNNALARLAETNTKHGYGAYFGVATRCTGLTRWQRGRVSDLVSLPALFVDIDRDPVEALVDLMRFPFRPSAIVLSGFGVHAYWLLREPVKGAFIEANQLLAALAKCLHGDTLTVAHCMRLLDSHNTKAGRGNALCRLQTLQPDLRYDVAEFARLMPKQQTRPPTRSPAPQRGAAQSGSVNPRLVAAVAAYFLERGYRRRDGWLNGPCLFSQRHHHSDAHRSFGFNADSGYGYCYVCGTLLLRDLCPALGLQPSRYGGLLAASTA